MDALTALASRWSESSSDEKDLAEFTADDFKDFSPYQMTNFLGTVLHTVLNIYFIYI